MVGRKNEKEMHQSISNCKHAAAPKGVSNEKKSRPKAWIASVVLVIVLVSALVPQLSFALPITPSYLWYTSHVEGQPYVLAGDSDFVGFINVVNGTADVNNDNTPDPADNFKGDTVELTNNVSLGNQKIVPIGGSDTGKSFDGIFDGNDKTVSNFSLSATGASGDLNTSEKIGLFGAAGPGSEIKNLKIGTGAAITVTIADSAESAKNIGLVVGCTEGTVTNCSTIDGASITVNYNADTAATNRYPLENIGGVVGSSAGDVTGCVNGAAVTVLYNGNPVDDPDYDGGSGTAGDTSVMRAIRNVAGVVGQAGTEESAGAVIGCSNSGKVDVETTKLRDTVSALVKDYSTGLYVGGITGYAWGNIADCSNTGQVYAKHVFSAGGVVGCIRGTYAGNFGIETGTAPTDFYTVKNCTNDANVTSQGHGGGIVGIAGAGVDITACLNGSVEPNIEIIGENSTKPFPSGIASETYGVVSYCANFGIVATGTANTDGTHAALGSGYYASGIVGLLANDGDGVGSEVYSCYNAGYVYASGDFRNRALVGDNEGSIHNCVAAKDMGTDQMYYTEGGSGVASQCAFVDATTLKNDGAIDTETYTDIEKGTTALSLLNVMAAQEGTWEQYWLKSENNINNGYIALVTQDAGWSTTSIADATVALKKNAEYTGVASIPEATVTLGGETLIQNVDYKVVPVSGSNVQMDTPYTANIVGIGHYSGTATQLLNYQIGKGDLASCSVAITSEPYDWEAHPASSLAATITNLGGQVVDPSEYELAFDTADTDLTSGEAINAHLYTVIVTAKDTSSNYTGSTSGEFSVTPVQILWKDDEGDAKAAIAHGVSYSGVQKDSDGTMKYAASKDYDWTSTNNKMLTDDALPTFEYTGHDIKPTITSITYKGVSLKEGVDFTTLYYDAFLTGATETHNIGVKGGSGYGYVTARYVYGGNFNRSEVMYFRIVDTAVKNDLANAEIECPATINFEDGSTYKPVEVWYGGSKLVEGTDYTIAYTDNDKVGTASYTITAVDGSEFTGKKTGTFDLVASAAYEFTYTVDADSQTASITGVNYTGANATFKMDIPETVEKDGVVYTVTSIAEKAFGGSGQKDFIGAATNTSKRKIVSVTIPKTVTSIGQFAFGSGSASNPMTQLTEVTFAKGSALETIGNSAFRKTGITSVTIPAGVTDIAQYAYRDSALSGKTVTFLATSATEPTIAKDAFYDITNVAASGYDTATAAKTFVTTTMASAGWTWEALSALADLSSATIADIADQTYTGSAITPELTVTLDSKTLVKDVDYTVDCTNNIEVGTATATITGIGAYNGEASKTFTIKAKAPVKYTISKNFVGGNNGAVTIIGEGATLYPTAGTKVRFRTSPKTGYMLTKMSYTNKTTGKTIALKRVSGTGKAGTNAEYEFTMPSSDVSLNATFEVNKRNITKKITGSGSVIVVDNPDGTKGSLYPQVGQSVTFKAPASNGYKLTRMSYTLKSSGKTVALTKVPGTTSTYTFKMPNEDVTLNATFVVK